MEKSVFRFLRNDKMLENIQHSVCRSHRDSNIVLESNTEDSHLQTLGIRRFDAVNGSDDGIL